MNTNPNDPVSPVSGNATGEIGLTKREHFASIALQGLISSNYSDLQGNVITSIQYADELIRQLNKDKPGYDHNLINH